MLDEIDFIAGCLYPYVAAYYCRGWGKVRFRTLSELIAWRRGCGWEEVVMYHIIGRDAREVRVCL